MTQKTVVTLEMADSNRMRELEQALEYAINRADGLCYTLDGVPLLYDPKITDARKLLPHVRWQWVMAAPGS